MDRAMLAAIVGILYREAEEEAAEVRRRWQVRRARMRRRRMQRRCAIFAFVSGYDQTPSRRYAQINNYVPILRMFFSEADLKPAFRLSRDTINMLVQMLPEQKPHGWSHEIEVAVCLYWLACGTSYRVTADIFAMPRATVCRIVHSLVEEMLAFIHNIICFPKPEEMEEVGAGFARLAGHEAFRCVAGALDGCHIRILPPAEPQRKCYINRKLFPSVVLQGVCDSNGKFLDTYIGNTGSVHDALILRRSPMYKESLYPPAGFFLLGDGGYPCLQHPVTLITPYRQPVAGQVAARFNKHHAKARNIIERTFGMLKTRWRSIFLRALEIRPLFAPKVVAACCILHNLCLTTGDTLEEEHREEEEVHWENVPDYEEELSGNDLCTRLAAQVSAPEELPACLREHNYY